MTEIRAARPDEALLLAAVQEQASVAALAHIFPPELYSYPREAVRARWLVAATEPATRALIALAEDGPIGAALVREEWLEGLYVVPDRWGTGLAGELHDRALAAARGLGSPRCHLWVLENNARARRFYERRGWRKNGDTRVVEYPPNPLDIGYSLGF